MNEQILARVLDPLAWLSAITACVVAWIAYQQHTTARAELRLALYAKRYEVYEALKTLLGTIFQDANLSVEAIYEFSAQTGEARFLFDPDILEYLETVRTKAIRLRALNSKLHEEDLPIGSERLQTAEEERRLLDWFVRQTEAAPAQFEPYLRFRDL